jgi:glyoxylase-like metal-dependent hydrolase (beta-lactamase superfamily II)/8-oxo-dGTP pyrophosphatase MutT (NUDIX family)
MPPIAIRPAATLVLLRPAAHAFEMLMLKRHAGAAFLGGAYVFPGGALEPADAAPAMHACIDGVDDAGASARLGLAHGGLAYWAAAVRECFEEAGILIATGPDGAALAGERVQSLAAHRLALHAGTLSFDALLRTTSLRIPASSLAYFQHWITPPKRTRRYDTRFFLAAAPAHQEGAHDDVEIVGSAWMTPREALARADSDEIEVAFATRIVLGLLARHDSIEAAMAWARAADDIPCIRPCVAQGRRGEIIFRPGDAAYHEVHWCDPGETTETCYDLVPGVAKRLDPQVTRIVAPNPGMMTGPGTNTYLVGREKLAVIDPGPDDASHVEAILAAAAGRIAWILCTHTHRDHSPAAAALQRATGATVIGRPAPPGGRQDETFAPGHVPRHGERLMLGDLVLDALHTPGHASNHLCYRLASTGMLFTGDHVMQGSTVVINPPDGDMQAYLRSLEALLDVDIAIIAPGHGYLIGAAHQEIRRLIAHRLAREAKVISVLTRVGMATAEALLPAVYDDVDARRHAVAARSLAAHLRKLVADGRVRQADGRYVIA